MLNLAKGTVTNRRCARHVGRCTGFITLVLAVNQILPTSAYADDPAHEAEHDVILHMNEQIQELQAKAKELETRLNTITPAAPALGRRRRAPRPGSRCTTSTTPRPGCPRS